MPTSLLLLALVLLAVGLTRQLFVVGEKETLSDHQDPLLSVSLSASVAPPSFRLGSGASARSTSLQTAAPPSLPLMVPDKGPKLGPRMLVAVERPKPAPM